jgi:hypothetical protein
MRDEIFDDDRLKGRGSILPVHIHAEPEAVDEHRQKRRRFSCSDRGVKLPRHRRNAEQTSPKAMQPVNHGQTTSLIAEVSRRLIEVVADGAASRLTLELMVDHPRGLYCPGYPFETAPRLPDGCSGQRQTKATADS